METEMKDRAEKAQLLNGPGEKQPYRQQQGMAYQEPAIPLPPQQQTGVTYQPSAKGGQTY